MDLKSERSNGGEQSALLLRKTLEQGIINNRKGKGHG